MSGDLPVILVISIDESKFDSVITLLGGVNGVHVIPNGDIVPGDKNAYCRINTKYYTAIVQFSPIDSPTSCVDSHVPHIEAIILNLDHSVDSYPKELEVCKSVLRYARANINILLSKHSIPEEQKPAVIEWCIENECELIELECDGIPISNNDPDTNEKFGKDRLVEAIQAYRWPNLKSLMMTANGMEHVDNLQNYFLLPEFHMPVGCPFAVPANTPSETPPEYDINFESNYSPEKLDELLQTLRSMKMNLSSMSGTEKLDRAEEVVKTFWSAIGGDKDEFSDSEPDVV